MSWITPITDRTQSDVDFLKRFADRIRTTGWENVSQADKDRWLFGNIDTLFTSEMLRVLTIDGDSIKLGSGNIKGAINTWDIFRITNNLSHIIDFVNQYRSGSFTPFTPINPNREGIITLTEMDSIRTALESLMIYSLTLPTTPTVTYSTRPTVHDINALEQIELDAYRMMRSVFNEFWLDVGVWDDELIWHDIPLDTVCVFCGIWNDLGIWNDRQYWQD